MLVMTLAVLSLAALLGFVVFANFVSRRVQPSAVSSADGIVVLTGAHKRIDVGVRLLEQGLGRRLLISGVHHKTKPVEVQHLAGLDQRLFRCCVDFGYVAQDTIGNAEETRDWAAYHHFRRLIVVTSSYHMPRSLVELRRTLPDAELIAYPVTPAMLGDKAWWLHYASARLLAAEYLKLIPSGLRYVAARLMRPFEASSVASTPRLQRAATQ